MSDEPPHHPAGKKWTPGLVVQVDLAAMRKLPDVHIWRPGRAVDLDYCLRCGAWRLTGDDGSVAFADGPNAPFHDGEPACKMSSAPPAESP